MSNLVGLREYKIAKEYSNFNINLAYDTVYTAPKKRDIAREMKLGYLKLLSNKQH